MNWFTFICLSIVFMISPFQWGLFYESNIKMWEWVISVLFILNLLWYWIRERQVLIKNRLYFLVLLLPLMYVAAVPFALNQEGNGQNIFRFFTYAFFFLLLIWTKESPRISKLYPYIFNSLGIAFLMFAVANIFGVLHLQTSMVGCVEPRSCGPVRYPNTFGAIMGAYWFYTLAAFIYQKALTWRDGLIILLLAGYAGIIMLTFSRGTYIFFGATFVLALLLLYKKWKKIIFISLLVLGLSLGVFNLLSMDKHIDFNGFSSLTTRFASISPHASTAIARESFYKDALSMSKNSPLFGFGGKSWTIYYPKYANRGNGLDQVHNGFLEFLIEIGWVGLSVYVLVLALLIFLIFKSNEPKERRIGVVLALAAIFGHAMVDYDLSFGTIWLLIFWLMAMGVSTRQSLSKSYSKSLWTVGNSAQPHQHIGMKNEIPHE